MWAPKFDVPGDPADRFQFVRISSNHRSKVDAGLYQAEEVRAEGEVGLLSADEDEYLRVNQWTLLVGTIRPPGHCCTTPTRRPTALTDDRNRPRPTGARPWTPRQGRRTVFAVRTPIA